jgi:hypothetical protein
VASPISRKKLPKRERLRPPFNQSNRQSTAVSSVTGDHFAAFSRDARERVTWWLKSAVAALEKKITTVQQRHEENRKALFQQTRRAPVKANGPAPIELPTDANFATTPQDDVLATPLYTRSPLAQFNAMTADIEKRIAVLRERGDVDMAKDATVLLKHFDSLRSGDYPVVSDVPEIHMIGLHEASNARHAIAPAKVRVTYTGSPIILVLTSYDSVEWHIEVGPDVQIDQVIVSGHHEQRMKGLPDSVPVWKETPDEGRQAFYVYKRSDRSFRKAVKRLHELTGRGVLTFQKVPTGERSTWSPGWFLSTQRRRVMRTPRPASPRTRDG